MLPFSKFKEATSAWVLGLPKTRGVVWGRTLKASLSRVGHHIWALGEVRYIGYNLYPLTSIIFTYILSILIKLLSLLVFVFLNTPLSRETLSKKSNYFSYGC